MKTIFQYLLPLFVFLSLITSCASEKGDVNEIFEVNVILREEPDRIHPMLSQASVATQIESHILLPLMEFDPIDLQLKPVLVSGPPEVDTFGENGSAFTFQMRPEAKWEDGTDITGNDYYFTLKAALNPHTPSNAWKAFLGQIDSVSVDKADPKKFTVYLDESYQLALPVTANFNVYPRHYYDADGLLDQYSISDLRQDSVTGPAEEFGKHISRSIFSRDSVMGSGPYRLSSWSTGQSLVLDKVDDWWGKDLIPAYPDRINYLFVPDESTGITMLRSGQADIISGISPTVFADLKSSSDSAQLSFHTPQVMQYYYLGLNTKDDVLKDKSVRQALAHLLDLELMAKVLMADLATPIASPIHTSKSYYNKTLKPVDFNPVKAKELLSEAGWSDSDNDGTIDKSIDGAQTELDLDILVTQKELGRNVARILKENAAEVGISVNIKSQEWGEIIKDVTQRQYDIVAMATRQYPGLDDLYQSWHTSSIGPDGRNITAFGNERTDSIIEQLRITEDEEVRNDLFMEIQQIIYDEQPMIFLFAPTETIVHSADLEMTISSRRPGYFEATAKPK